MSPGRRRIGIFGGTFNPPHLGHVVVAEECRWQLRLDEVHLVVAARPPHRDAPAVDAEIRYALVRAAVGDHPALQASRAEIDRPGTSFTVDTLRDMARAHPDDELVLVIGADQLLAFTTWREPDAIVDLARLAVVARGGADLAVLADAGEAIAPGRIDLVAMPAIDISSTMLRERIRDGIPYEHLLPGPVAEVIAREHLYRSR